MRSIRQLQHTQNRVINPAVRQELSMTNPVMNPCRVDETDDKVTYPIRHSHVISRLTYAGARQANESH